MKGGLILAIIGAVILVLSMSVVVISLALLAFNGPRTRVEEAALGFVPGGCCSGIALVMILGGVVWMLMGRKKV